MTPANVGTCHLSGHSFGRRTANASILMKFHSLHKVKVVNVIVTTLFCDSRRLSILVPVILQAIVTDGGDFNGDNNLEEELQELQF